MSFLADSADYEPGTERGSAPACCYCGRRLERAGYCRAGECRDLLTRPPLGAYKRFGVRRVERMAVSRTAPVFVWPVLIAQYDTLEAASTGAREKGAGCFVVDLALEDEQRYAYARSILPPQVRA